MTWGKATKAWWCTTRRGAAAAAADPVLVVPPVGAPALRPVALRDSGLAVVRDEVPVHMHLIRFDPAQLYELLGLQLGQDGGQIDRHEHGQAAAQRAARGTPVPAKEHAQVVAVHGFRLLDVGDAADEEQGQSDEKLADVPHPEVGGEGFGMFGDICQHGLREGQGEQPTGVAGGNGGLDRRRLGSGCWGAPQLD